jgi:hypothetical protein
MKVVFAGDLFLGGDLLNKFVESIVYSNTFTNADIKIVNLEQPISDSELIADKYRANPKTQNCFSEFQSWNKQSNFRS